ncbi:phosphoribosylanthranilate isomerase [Pelagibacteraceae bacterium]|nr:phosphoribosylanthranilate isomerase [Pelagibacteraceae bacterium]
MSDIQIKICGVKNKEIAKHAIDAGASFVGFIFFEKSHRNITIENCEQILTEIKDLTIPVAVTVNPDDKLLDDLLRIGFQYIQLHGQETLEMVERIKLEYDFKIIKAFGISSSEDLDELVKYEPFVEYFLLDSPPQADVQGGTGHRFDWKIIENLSITKNFFLSGGLNKDNIISAINLKKTSYFDVSSGVENSEGIKDRQLITEFIDKAKNII